MEQNLGYYKWLKTPEKCFISEWNGCCPKKNPFDEKNQTIEIKLSEVQSKNGKTIED